MAGWLCLELSAKVTRTNICELCRAVGTIFEGSKDKENTSQKRRAGRTEFRMFLLDGKPWASNRICALVKTN